MSKEKYTERTFFANLNAQNVPRPGFHMWYIRKADDTSVPEHTIEGYEFTPEIRVDSFAKAEGASTKRNFRKAFLPEEGHYWLSRDFSGQELRIVANLSGEKAWVDAFLTGGDIHKATAVTLWGEENYDATKRKAAKAINFGLIYGISGPSLADGLRRDGVHVSADEAQSYINDFFKKLPNIKRFMDAQVRQVVNNKDLANIYGRRRRFLQYFKPDGTLDGRGRRAAYNFPVQSIGADVTKLALIKLYDKLINAPEYKGKLFFMSTIHDEINFSVSYDIIKEIAKQTGELMRHEIPGMPVPIITGLEIGHSMGLTWAFEQDPVTLELKPEEIPLSDDDLKEIEILKTKQ